MIFESLWPLAFLLAVPVVIILYLLKPKGKDYRISSSLLWEKILKNQQSKTFLEKFIHNLLMYVQIVILLLMVLALMSPYLRREGSSRGDVILVFDTSGSMQHDAGEGSSRIEEAVAEAKGLISASEGSSFSVVTTDCRGSELLAVSLNDKSGLYAVLRQITCCDGAGDLKAAESVVDTLRGADGEDPAEVIVYTDGIGAESAMSFSEYFDAEIHVLGAAVDNVAVNFLSCVQEEEGCRAAASLTNYSDAGAGLELSLYAGERLVAIRQAALAANETSLCYFEPFDWDGEPLKSEISSVRFEGKTNADSLAADNTAYALAEQSSVLDAVLVGGGNTYLEKAYQAATGKTLLKVTDESAAENAVQICDADAGAVGSGSRMVFSDSELASGTKGNVMLTVTSCDLTAGLSDFTIGVNQTKIYEVPDWGKGFLWAGSDCAGYYGEQDGVKVIVVGFDLRESDFPLTAEFPVFIANAVGFLGDTSLLADNVYEAGETVIFHPQADFDVGELAADTAKAGLYTVGQGELKEQYVVRFAAGSQSDGRITAEGTAGAEYRSRLVKKQLKNVLLVVILLLLIAEWMIYVRQTRRKSRFYLGVRAVLLALLVLALCSVTVPKRESSNTTIFLVDISNSNAENLSAMEDEIRDDLKKMPDDNRYGIVTFGKNSLVEQFLVSENHFSGIMSLPDQTATNFEEAVSRALSMIPADGAGRIVVLTDGKETRGDITGTASALVSRQIELLAKIYEVSVGDDAYIEQVELPGYLYQGDAYTMTVTVESSYDTDAEISLWSGSMQTACYEVHLNTGTNRFQFQQTVTGESAESFTVTVLAEGDTCAENDSYYAYAAVDAAPKVLLVSGMDEDSTAFETLLQAANINYHTVSALNAPDTLEGLLEYRSVILENVYLSDLPEGFLSQIETYVKDYGNGLICCGGEDSFALGGYRGSVLETVLPVDMQPRGVNEVPPTSMVMVIDHSGSMIADLGSGATSLDLAITAASAAVDELRSTDYVGVLTFDDTYSWVVEPTLCEDKEEIKEKIETIAEGGGTTIKPALWAALDGVKDCGASNRHVVLLTDGQGETRSFSDVINAYNEANVTLSTVAVGEDSDGSLLEWLADECGGRYYYSDLAEDIPKIFAQEVLLSGETYLQNGTFSLAVNGTDEITRGLFAEGWPQLYGYVSATPKSAAKQLITSEKDDPVLTVMQYGLGHTVAWNTDVTNEWTAGFAGEEDYAALWKRIVDYSTGSADIGEDSVDVYTASGSTSICYRAEDYGENTRVEAVYTDPEGNTGTVELAATAPGEFEAELDTDLTGVYSLSVRRIDGGEIVHAMTTAATVQYTDEYKFGISSASFLRFVEQYGRLLEPDEDFWQQRTSGARERYELAGWLILLSILWFVMDIALRRFHFLPQETRLCRRVRARLEMRRSAKGQTAGEKPLADSQSAAPEPAAETQGKQKKQKPKKEEKKKQEPQTLDTSALLKKKDQRGQ